MKIIVIQTAKGQAIDENRKICDEIKRQRKLPMENCLQRPLPHPLLVDTRHPSGDAPGRLGEVRMLGRAEWLAWAETRHGQGGEALILGW